ncbi:2551_t:CDS:1, partial [Gigaspora rosea]
HVRTVLIDKERVQMLNPIFFELLNSEEFTTASSDTNSDREFLTQAFDVYDFGVIMWTKSSGKEASI